MGVQVQKNCLFPEKFPLYYEKNCLNRTNVRKRTFGQCRCKTQPSMAQERAMEVVVHTAVPIAILTLNKILHMPLYSVLPIIYNQEEQAGASRQCITCPLQKRPATSWSSALAPPLIEVHSVFLDTEKDRGGIVCFAGFSHAKTKDAHPIPSTLTSQA
jgi:hypothetical protein